MNAENSESMLELSRRVAKVLWIGAAASMVLILIGIIALLGNASANVRVTLPLDKLPSGLAEVEPAAFITLGILVMIVTPIARVFILVEGFIARKEGTYVLIGSVVLAVLLISIMIGGL
ncbi:MAG: DUF1634 domain-containing protein [Thermoplasmata archaeon]